MEGFKNKLVNGDIKIAADEGITQALLRELRKDETLGAKFEKDFDGLTFDSKKALIELAERVQIKGINGQPVIREATSYNLPSFREEEYKLVDSVEIGEKLSALESDIMDIFPELSQEGSKDDTSEFVGPPEAPKKETVAEVEDKEVQEEKPFDLAHISHVKIENLTDSQLAKLAGRILEADISGQTIDDFISNENKFENGFGDMVDQNGIAFTVYADALVNTPDPQGSVQVLTLYIQKGSFLRKSPSAG